MTHIPMPGNALTPRGWICPKCTKVYSPSISECWSCNQAAGITYTSTTDSTFKGGKSD